MKTQTFSHPRTPAAERSANKSNPVRHSGAKQVGHRYERRKVREFLRHNFDSEEDSLQFERFG